MSADTTENQIDTIIPISNELTVGDITHRIGEFSGAKAILALTYVSDIISATGVGQLVNPEADTNETSDILVRVLRAVPALFTSGQPPFQRLIGLIITPNSQLRKWDEGEYDIAAELQKQGRSFLHEATLDQTVTLVEIGVRRIGVTRIIKNLPNLTALLSSLM